MNQYKNVLPQLFNLANDPGEQNNLFDKEPEKATKMLAELNEIRKASSTR